MVEHRKSEYQSEHQADSQTDWKDAVGTATKKYLDSLSAKDLAIAHEYLEPLLEQAGDPEVDRLLGNPILARATEARVEQERNDKDRLKHG